MENNQRDSLVRPGERVDDLQNGYYVIQNPQKFCFGMDAVLLSGFAKIKKDEHVLDMGTGRDYSCSSESKDTGRTFYRFGDTGRMCGAGAEKRSL